MKGTNSGTRARELLSEFLGSRRPVKHPILNGLPSLILTVGVHPELEDQAHIPHLYRRYALTSGSSGYRAVLDNHVSVP